MLAPQPFPGNGMPMAHAPAPPPAPQLPDRFRIEDREVSVLDASGEAAPPRLVTLLFDSATGETSVLVRDGDGFAWRRLPILPSPGQHPGGPMLPGGPPSGPGPGWRPPTWPDTAPPRTLPQPPPAAPPLGPPTPFRPEAEGSPSATAPPPGANPLVDVTGFGGQVSEAERMRERRRVGEEAFLALATGGSVILDCRSREAFDRLHVRGAVNLPFPDITAESLARVVDSPDTRILIYCNNNFANAPEAFPAKVAAAALNHHTFATLLAYGYRDIFELGPLVDVTTTRLPLEGTDAPGG